LGIAQAVLVKAAAYNYAESLPERRKMMQESKKMLALLNGYCCLSSSINEK